MYKIHVYYSRIGVQESNRGVGTVSKRININLSDKAFEELQELSGRKGKNMSEILRDALALEKWFQDTQDDGDNILVENTDTGTARHVIRQIIRR